MPKTSMRTAVATRMAMKTTTHLECCLSAQCLETDRAGGWLVAVQVAVVTHIPPVYSGVVAHRARQSGSMTSTGSTALLCITRQETGKKLTTGITVMFCFLIFDQFVSWLLNVRAKDKSISRIHLLGQLYMLPH